MFKIIIYSFSLFHILVGNDHQYPPAWDELQNDEGWELIKETDRVKVFSKEIEVLEKAQQREIRHDRHSQCGLLPSGPCAVSLQHSIGRKSGRHDKPADVVHHSGTKH